MDRAKFLHDLDQVVNSFCTTARDQLRARWEAWKLDMAHRAEHEVVGGLVARQVTLAEQLAMAPSTWNEHLAPLVLRGMAEVHITLAWILLDQATRAVKFIHYGLGQKKLELEHHRAQLGNDPPKGLSEMLSHTEAWIDSQRFTFLTSVNLGSWSGQSVRKMAEEAGCLDFYDLVYTPFSACSHSMWYHVATYNLAPCDCALHQMHQIPTAGESAMDPHYFSLAAKYLQKTFAAFDQALGIDIGGQDLYEVVIADLQRILSENESSEGASP